MTSREARSFLLVAGFTFLIGTLIVGLRYAFDDPDSAGTYVLAVLQQALIFTVVAFAFGWSAVTRSRVALAAGLALSVAIFVPAIMGFVGIHSGASILAAVANVGGTALLAVAVAGRRGPLWAPALLMVAGNATGWLSIQLELAPQIELVGTTVEYAALTALVFMARAHADVPDDVKPATAIERWREAGEGARFIVYGEQIRMWVLVGLFVVGIQFRSAAVLEIAPYFVTLGHVTAICFCAYGLLRMRQSPAGRSWLTAALGAAALGVVGGLFEMIAVFGSLVGLDGAMSTSGELAFYRVIGQCLLSPLVAIAFAQLGERAGVDIVAAARRCAVFYLVALLAMITQVTLRDLMPGKPIAVGVAGIVAIVFLLIGALKLADFAKKMREALPAGAANEAFGDAPRG